MKLEELKDELLIAQNGGNANIAEALRAVLKDKGLDGYNCDITALVESSRELANRLQAKNAALGELRPVIQNARMVRAIAESYAELDPKWAKSTLDYFHGVVTEPLERAAELSTVEGGKP